MPTNAIATLPATCNTLYYTHYCLFIRLTKTEQSTVLSLLLDFMNISNIHTMIRTMMMSNRRRMYQFVFAVVGMALIFGDFDHSSKTRLLQEEQQGQPRELASSGECGCELPPPVVFFDCPLDGDMPVRVNWTKVEFQPNAVSQKLHVQGHVLHASVNQTGSAQMLNWELNGHGNLITIFESVIGPDQVLKGDTAAFPSNYATLTLTLEKEIDGLFVSVADLDSNHKSSNAARISLFDVHGQPVNKQSTETAITGETLKLVDDTFAYETKSFHPVHSPGYQSSIYVKATGKVKTIQLDMATFVFDATEIGSKIKRSVFPALDLGLCGVPVDEEEEEEPFLPPLPTGNGTIFNGTQGVSGDPLIMGLSGQIFKFYGRTGAWYSAGKRISINLCVQNCLLTVLVFD